MGCSRAQLLILLNKIRKELKCGQDRAILDLYIERIEGLAENELEAEIFH